MSAGRAPKSNPRQLVELREARRRDPGPLDARVPPSDLGRQERGQELERPVAGGRRLFGEADGLVGHHRQAQALGVGPHEELGDERVHERDPSKRLY